MSKICGKKRHPPRDAVGLGLAGALQEGAISAVDQSKPVSGEPNGRLAQGVACPGRGLNFVAREKRAGDGTIACALEARVDDTKHLTQSASTLWRDPRIGGRRWASPALPETRDRLQAIGRGVVERHDRDGLASQGHCAVGAHAKDSAADAQPLIAGSDLDWINCRVRGRSNRRKPQRSHLKDQGLRIGRRCPGRIRLGCRDVGVRRERITPIFRPMPRRQHRRDARRLLAVQSLSDIPGCASEIPRRGPEDRDHLHSRRRLRSAICLSPASYGLPSLAQRENCERYDSRLSSYLGSPKVRARDAKTASLRLHR
jgi:hypothetical protein